MRTATKHGLWGMSQMLFTKYVIVVDDDVDMHNISEVLFRLCANTDPQHDSLFTKGPSDVLDHATSEIASGSKLGADVTKKIPGEGFKLPWPPLIKMDEYVRKRIDALFIESKKGSACLPRASAIGHPLLGATQLPPENDKPPGGITEWIIHRLWPHRWGRATLAVAAVVTIAVGAYPFAKSVYMRWFHTHPFPGNPVVISIQPEGGFGELRADGLTRGLITTPELGIIRLKADIGKMKEGRIDEMIGELRKQLAKHNAIAVVGPSISESTLEILDCVQSSGVNLPVIIESSSPRKPLKWDSRPFPLFRLSSGIDERAVEVAQIARRLLDARATVAFLIERVLSGESYGELLYRHTLGHLDAATRERILVRYFDHSHAAKIVAEQQIRELFASDSIVFLLGLGEDFHSVMDAFFRAESKTTRARLVGVMCAYKITPSLQNQEKPYRRSQVIELTDLSPLSPGLPKPARKLFEKNYHSEPFNPAVRDQAFSFDAGLCLAGAMKDVLSRHSSNPGMTYEDAIRHVAAHLIRTTVEGTSGKVAFRSNGSGRGQNIGSALQLARMDDQGCWNPITTEQLLETPKP